MREYTLNSFQAIFWWLLSFLSLVAILGVSVESLKVCVFSGSTVWLNKNVLGKFSPCKDFLRISLFDMFCDILVFQHWCIYLEINDPYFQPRCSKKTQLKDLKLITWVRNTENSSPQAMYLTLIERNVLNCLGKINRSDSLSIPNWPKVFFPQP